MAYGAGRHQLPAPEEPPPPSYQSLYGSAPPYSHRIFINQLTCEVAPSVSEALSDHEPPDSALSCATPVGGDLGVGTLPLHGVEVDRERTPESRGGVHPSAPEPSGDDFGGAMPSSDDEVYARHPHWAAADRPMTHKSWGGSAPTTPEPRDVILNSETPTDDLEVLTLPIGGVSAADQPVAHESGGRAASCTPVPGDLSYSGSAEDGGRGAHTQPLRWALDDRQVTSANGGEGARGAPETLDHVQSSSTTGDGGGAHASPPGSAVADRPAATGTDEDGMQPSQPSGGYRVGSGVVPPSYAQREHIEPVTWGVSRQPTVVTQTAAGRHPTYTGFSFFTCIFCFLPLGILALYYSRRSANATNEADAKANAMKARTANVAAVVLGLSAALAGGLTYYNSLSRNDTYTTAKPQTTAAAYYNYKYYYSYNNYYYYGYNNYYNYYYGYSYGYSGYYYYGR